MRGVVASTMTDLSVALPNLDNIIRGLLYVYVVSLPFKHLLFVERNGFIILIVLLLLWCAVNRRHFFTRTPIDIPLIAFVAWVAVTIPFAAFPLYSFKEFAKLLQQGLIFYVVVYFFRDESRWARLMWVLVGTSLIVSGYGVLEFMSMVGILQSESRLLMLESVTSGEVWLSTYLVMVIPLCFALFILEKSRHERRFAFGATVMATVCLALTFSRAGLVALLSELSCLVWIVRRKALIVAAALIGLLIGAVVAGVIHYGLLTVPGTDISIRGGSTSSMVQRIDIWKHTLARIVEHPLVGIGYGKDNFKLVYGQLPEQVQVGHYPILSAGTHNTFLDLALGVGLPGLALFVWLLQRIAAQALAGFRQSENPITKAMAVGVGVSVIGLAVRLLFDHMLIGTLALQFWVMVAMAMAACRAPDNPAHAALRQ
jgi:putative inorganic carbon (hco3(-)) transporter